MTTLNGRVYFTMSSELMGYWDSATGSFTYRSQYDPALVAQLPLAAGPSPSIYAVGPWMQMADGRMLQRIDDAYRANPDYDPYVMAIVWDPDLTVGTADAITAMWPYTSWETESNYIEARFGLGCVVNGENWLSWQNPTPSGDPMPGYAVVAPDLTMTDRAFYPPYSNPVAAWGSCQVYHSDGFIYRGFNSDDQFERYNPTTEVWEWATIQNTAIDPDAYRWHTYGFTGFTESGLFVVTDSNSSDLHPPATNGKSPGVFKVYDHTLFPWQDVMTGTWTPYDGPPLRYWTPTPPAGVTWGYLGTDDNASQCSFIVGNRVYFSVTLPEATVEQYPVGPDDLRYGYDDQGNGLGNGAALYSADLDTWEMELEFAIPFVLLGEDGSLSNPNDSWFNTHQTLTGMAYAPAVSPVMSGEALGTRRRFVP